MNNPGETVRAIFLDAVEIADLQERQSFVDHACGGNAALRREVEELLQSQEAAGHFLPDKPSNRLPATSMSEAIQRLRARDDPVRAPDVEQPGDWIGRYKLLQKIGEGGCGLVYLAGQEEPLRRLVALKVIKLGMDTRQVIARFNAERQALALMDHPNIARVLDAGATETGRPYFVMELVQGVRITDYCGQNRLPTRARLELFIQVCQAVQHAHQKGIIHRDLKPSNVLVTVNDGVPVPKVIDFGIAKATEGRLADDTLFTAFEQFLGTPAYMSPEQAEMSNLDVDTRSDIYSLGVLLYELLTGTTPFETKVMLAAGLDELRRTIRNKEPARPSTRLRAMVADVLTTEADRQRTDASRLIHLLRGDLDWIVMKCLEKDRGRRYPTANGLAADVRRHLNGEPVVARPPSRLYEFQKTVGRHKVGFAATAGLIATLAAGVLVSTLEVVRARRAEGERRVEQQRAELETTNARVAEAQAREALWASYLAQAQAGRWSRRTGQRFASLDALKKAATIHPSLELRNEAIACLALPDLRVTGELFEADPRAAVAFDQELQRYAEPDAYGTVKVRRLKDNGEVMSLTGCEAPFHYLAFSPNGRYLLARFGQAPAYHLRIWDLDRRDVLPTPPDLDGHSPAFTPDSSQLVVGTYGTTIVFYDLMRSSVPRELPASIPSPGIAFDPEGGRFAENSYRSRTVVIRDTTTGQILRSLPHPEPVMSAAWHPNGEVLATGCMDTRVYVWDLKTGNLRATLSGHEAEVTSVQFIAGGDLLTSIGWDSVLRLWDPWGSAPLVSIGIWAVGAWSTREPAWLACRQEGGTWLRAEVATPREYRVLHSEAEPHKGPLSCEFSPDGQWLASGHSDGVRLWAAGEAREAQFLPEGLTASVLFDPGGNSLITCGESGVKRWPLDRDGGRIGAAIRIGPPGSLAHASALGTACLSGDGRSLAFVESDQVVVLELPSGSEKARFTEGPSLKYLALSPNGQWAATGFWQVGRNVRVWNLRTVHLERELPDTASGDVSFSPDGKWLVTSTADAHRFWEVGSWRCAYVSPRRETGGLQGPVAFTRDGRIAAIACTRRSVQLVDPTSGHEFATLESPTPQTLSCLSFSPDGTRLAAGVETKQLQLWDLRLIRQQLATMNLDWELPPYPESARVEPLPLQGR